MERERESIDAARATALEMAAEERASAAMAEADAAAAVKEWAAREGIAERFDAARTAASAIESDRKDSLAEKKAALRASICEQLASDMETMGPDWVKEWACPAGAPVNPTTGTEYRGGNAVTLMWAAREKGYADNRWCTFNGARRMGWHVRKGEKGQRIECWKPWTFDDGRDPDEADRSGHLVTRMRLTSIDTVFNFEQIEGAPALEMAAPDDDRGVFDIADILVESSRCPVDERLSDTAFYAPGLDRIVVPRREQFSSPAAFASTLLHEMGHSTAPELGRPTLGFEENPLSYAREEIVAELSAVFSSASLGISYGREGEIDRTSPEYSNHVAYLRHYAASLRENPDILFECAVDAQHACDAVISRYDAVAAERGVSRPRPEKLEPPQKQARQEDRGQRKEKSSKGAKGADGMPSAFARATASSRIREQERAGSSSGTSRDER